MRKIWTPGRRCFSVVDTPAMVPPVPAPQTNASTLPPAWSQISRPVRRCARKLARFSNWSKNQARKT